MAISKGTGSVIPAEYRASHEMDALSQRISDHVRSDDGRVDLPKLKRLAEANGCWHEEYAELNPGMIRMNVGNRLRGRARHGHEIKWE